MRIPLDYYRVLGVPTQVTPEQLNQAYDDRRMQLPRREYGDTAIASRQRLLTKAYEVLSDTQQRSEYDQKFQPLASTDDERITPSTETDTSQESSPSLSIPEIEISPDEQVGALLILSELGEYEQVIQWGEEFLSSSLSEIDGLDDLRLSIALAHLELSREQWQQNHYEKASQFGYKALELLPQSSNFAKIKQEITKELHLLRPYRILELLGQPESLISSRKRGLSLLRDLLEERQGIDGKGEDHSGLDVDNFLRFIQQLRIYLTLEEQIDLFTYEAERPSLVATYLAVYALIAQGILGKDPHAIVQAYQLLEILDKRQDVSLEKAVCALLLGQTKAANEALQQSKDRESLDFIRQQSQGSPDLLPGLYVYSKQWLETEVFSHFRDLAHQEASLTEYFADETVVSYLETYLEDHPQPISKPLIDQQPVGVSMASALSQSYPEPSQRSQRRRTSRSARYERSSVVSGTTATATLPSTGVRSRPSRPRPEYKENSPNSSDLKRNRRPRPVQTAKVGEQTVALQRKKKIRRQHKLKIKPLLFLIGAIGGLGLLGGLGVKMLLSANSPVAKLESKAVFVQLNEPIMEIPAENARLILPTGALTPEGAKDVIEAWLYSKARAFGADYQIEEISSILTGSLANLWENRAIAAKNSQSYWKYAHDVQVKALQAENAANRAVVEAQVKEVANLYERGRLNENRSYQETLQVRYTLAKQDGQWMIAGIQVLP